MVQVFCLERRVVDRRTCEITTEAVYGASSLEPGRVDATALLGLVPGQW